ncbi:MAG: transcription elongation factor GreA [Chloroflexota bacterium]
MTAKAKYTLTEAGHRRLAEELDQLEKRRGEVASNIRTAKGYGDLRENFEYHEAKKEQGFVEGRILELRGILNNCRVVSPADVNTTQVEFGCRVSLHDEAYGDDFDYIIVGPLEADPDNDFISDQSPLGKALVGRKVGDTVTVPLPAGNARYKITRITAAD